MRFGGKPNYTCGIVNKEFPNLASKREHIVQREKMC
jgi:hypothetical protein